MTASTAKPAAMPKEVKMQDVITLTARLAQVLAEEVDLLSEMKMANVEALQPEKLFLISALDTQRRLLEKYPHLQEKITDQDRRDLQEVMKVFNPIVEENNRRLLIAKSVNHRIVQAITEAVKDATHRRTYDGKGTAGNVAYQALSVTLNKMI